MASEEPTIASVAPSSSSRLLFAQGTSPIAILIAWQGLALLFCAMALFGEQLTDDGFFSPSFQSIATYLLMLVVWLPIRLIVMNPKSNVMPLEEAEAELIHQREQEEQVAEAGIPFWKKDLFIFFLLGFCDFEANFCMIYAYQYTSVVSVQVLDAAFLPLTMLLSAVFLLVIYKRHQLAAAVICVVGVMLYAYADSIYNNDDDDSSSTWDVLLGDMLVLLGSALQASYAILLDWYLNTLKLRQGALFSQPRTVGTTIIASTAFAILVALLSGWIVGDISDFFSSSWSPSWTWYFVGFCVIRVAFTSLAPLMLLLSSATIMSLSLQMSDIYTFVGALLFFDFTFEWLYVGAMALISSSIVIFCADDIRITSWCKLPRREVVQDANELETQLAA